jgi:predicted small lipoprotein YifL
MRSFALVLALSLSACGQAGDLYLPGKIPPGSAQPEDTQKKKDTATPAQSPPDTSQEPSPAAKP